MSGVSQIKILSSWVKWYIVTTDSSLILGRHIRETLADVASGAQTLEYYASLATTSVDQHIKLQNGSFAYVTKEPYGVVGGW